MNIPLSITNTQNQSKIAVVAVGYDRLEPMKRLLSSLNNADYHTDDVPLIISIDCSGNTALYEYVNSFAWNHGDKYVVIHQERLGLKEHIFSCGDFTKYFKAVVLLEDDIFVSPYYYDYIVPTVTYYDNEQDAACVALYSKKINENCHLPFTPYKTTCDFFATQTVITWGQCWTTRMWQEFRSWLAENPHIDWESLDIPDKIKRRKRAWSKFFYAYLVSNNKYVISPFESYTTNFNEAGEHNVAVCPIAQVPIVLRNQPLVYEPVNCINSYDAYMNPMGLEKVLKLDSNELCVDLFGDRPNYYSKRYVLSVNHLPYKTIRSFALSMRPIEANIINQIEGDGIYLYDTFSRNNNKEEKQPFNLLLYHLQGFDLFLLIKVIKYYIKQRLRKIFI